MMLCGPAPSPRSSAATCLRSERWVVSSMMIRPDWNNPVSNREPSWVIWRICGIPPCGDVSNAGVAEPANRVDQVDEAVEHSSRVSPRAEIAGDQFYVHRPHRFGCVDRFQDFALLEIPDPDRVA